MTSSRYRSLLPVAAPGSSPRSRAGPAGPDRFAGQLGRVASTLILGGGVFAMPLVAPLVGLIPFVAVLVGVWLALKYVLYPRTAETLISSGSGGGDGLAAAVARAGGGRAGWLLCLNGVVVYVLGAAFGYATIGHTALAAIMDTVGRSGASAGGLVIVGVGLGVVAWLAPQSVPERLVGPGTLMSVWAIGLGLATRLPDASGPAGLDWQGLGCLATFFAGVVLIGFQRARATSGRARQPVSDPCRLERGHWISLTAQTTQLVLMGVLLATVLIWAAAGAPVPFSGPTLWRMPSFPEFVRVVGVLLFAQVGTGWNNFARYPAMWGPAFRRRVVDRAMWVVLAVQVGWLVPVLWIVPTVSLRHADAAQSQSAAALADVARAALPPAVATTLALLAALVVLLGVTSACAGFVESLATETSNTWLALAGRRGPARLEQAYLGVAAVGAAVLLITGASVSAVLAVAGIAGGGIIIFVQPMLAGVQHRSQPAWRRGAIAAAAAITLLGTVDVMLRHVPLPWGGVVLLIAVLPLILTVATCRNVGLDCAPDWTQCEPFAAGRGAADRAGRATREGATGRVPAMTARERHVCPGQSGGRPSGIPAGTPHRPGSGDLEHARQPPCDPGRRERRLRSVGGKSVAVRPGVSDALVMKVAGHLTDRDHEILNMVSAHRVFTTDQLCDLFFTNLTTARHRLTTLYQLRLVDRFEPFRSSGSAPYHYVLDQLGAMVVAANRGVEFKDLGWKLDKVLALARSQRLAHTIGVNGFFASLVREARRRPGAELVEWWSETRCAAWGKGLVRPDGYGAWVEDGQAVEFLLEYDRHTEPLGRLVDKLDGYTALIAAAGRQIPVLFCFGSRRREANARRVLGNSSILVATAALMPPQSPLSAVWRPIGSGTGRRRLVELTIGLSANLPSDFAWPASAHPQWWYREEAPMPPGHERRTAGPVADGSRAGRSPDKSLGRLEVPDLPRG